MNVLHSLRYRPFVLLWSGQTTSRLGDSLYRIALAWWVLEKTGSAVAMGTALVFSQIPMLVFLLIGGVVENKLPLAFQLSVPVLSVSMFLSGLSTSIFALMWTHTLQELVPGNMLGRVYSIDALGSFVLWPVGFCHKGWATDLVGAPTVFLADLLGTMVLASLDLLHPAIRNLD